MARNPFKGFKDQKPSRRDSYIQPGSYVLRIDSVRLKENRSEDHNFVIETTVLHVTDYQEGIAKTKKGDKPFKSNAVGSQATHLLPLHGNGKESSLADIKAFSLTLIPDAEADDIDEEVMLGIVSDDQPLAGMMVRVRAYHVRTNADLDFTRVAYEAVVTNEDRLREGLITQEQFDLLSEDEQEAQAA